MLKKILSGLLCLSISFASVTAALSVSDYSEVGAATVYETPYYYKQMTDDAKEAYNSLKEAVFDCRKSVKLRLDIDQEEFDQIAELLIYHDPMTFNLKDLEASSKSANSVTFTLTYKYSKESYDKMVAAYEKKAAKVLDKLTDDMSKYKKIKTIHDYLINNTDYDLESKNNDNVYGTLIKNKAKCDGYAKTFSYICGQAGIRTVTVIGDDKEDNSDIMHMWNKVYYNKKWYNIDVTWDDPVGNIKNNLCYDFFMVSDNTLKKTHTEDNFSFEVPKADDDSRDYYIVNKKYAEDFETAKALLSSGVVSAAKKEKNCIVLKCSSKDVFEKTKNYVLNSEKLCRALSNAKKKTDSKLLTDIYSYGFNEKYYIIKLYVFYKNTDLEDYFNSTDEIGSDMLKALSYYGID